MDLGYLPKLSFRKQQENPGFMPLANSTPFYCPASKRVGVGIKILHDKGCLDFLSLAKALGACQSGQNGYVIAHPDAALGRSEKAFLRQSASLLHSPTSCEDSRVLSLGMIRRIRYQWILSNPQGLFVKIGPSSACAPAVSKVKAMWVFSNM